MKRNFRRHLEALSPLYEFAEEMLEAHDVVEGIRFPVHLAMEELFVNLVHYNPGARRDILVDVEVAGGGVVVTITDYDAAEFDVTRAIRDVLYRYRSGGELFEQIASPVTLRAYVSGDAMLPELLIEYRDAIRAEAGSQPATVMMRSSPSAGSPAGAGAAGPGDPLPGQRPGLVQELLPEFLRGLGVLEHQGARVDRLARGKGETQRGLDLGTALGRTPPGSGPARRNAGGHQR